MVQIIKENREPSTGEKFARAFANVGSSLGQNIPKLMMQKEEQKALQMQRMQEDEAAKRFGIDLSGIRDQKSRQAILENALKMQSDEQRALTEFNREQDLLFNKQNFEREMQEKQKESKGLSKEEIAQNERQESIDTAQRSFNTLAKVLKGGNVGKGSGIASGLIGGKIARDTGKFRSALGGLEAVLVDMVSKGTLSDSRFKYITQELLPKSTDRDEIIHGKLESLAEMIGLDPSELGIEENAGSLDDLSSANARKYKGRIVEDDNGNRYRSNGKNWIKQ